MTIKGSLFKKTYVRSIIQYIASIIICTQVFAELGFASQFKPFVMGSGIMGPQVESSPKIRATFLKYSKTSL